MDRDPRTYTIIGAAMEVHKVLGLGFLEAVYQEALEIEFESRRIPFRAQPTIALFYKDRELKKFYQPDFIC
jgi:GxxExxY protein